MIGAASLQRQPSIIYLTVDNVSSVFAILAAGAGDATRNLSSYSTAFVLNHPERAEKEPRTDSRFVFQHYPHD